MAERAGKKHREHRWICTGCGEKVPMQGFDVRARRCPECQDRPDADAIADGVKRHFDRIPAHLVRQLSDFISAQDASTTSA
jgi:hypothetical protein